MTIDRHRLTGQLRDLAGEHWLPRHPRPWPSKSSTGTFLGFLVARQTVETMADQHKEEGQEDPGPSELAGQPQEGDDHDKGYQPSYASNVILPHAGPCAMRIR